MSIYQLDFGWNLIFIFVTQFWLPRVGKTRPIQQKRLDLLQSVRREQASIEPNHDVRLQIHNEISALGSSLVHAGRLTSISSSSVNFPCVSGSLIPELDAMFEFRLSFSINIQVIFALMGSVAGAVGDFSRLPNRR